MSQKNSEVIKDKSEILFLYESTYSIPNGDPFTGEQRYDEETKKILVSDVRIKRFIRDHLLQKGEEIYVWSDLSQADSTGSGSAARMKSLKEKYKEDKSVKDGDEMDAKKLLQRCIDVRLFGGISTEEGDAVNLTGPVQFALLNPSLNEVDLRIHQNTSVFVSSVEKSRGAIGTTTVVPYSINQIHGWVNPYSAEHTALTDNDTNIMFKALWDSINLANTRTKSNQNSVVLLQIVYKKPTDKIYGVDRLIRLNTKDNMRGEQLRSISDYEFDFDELFEAVKSDKVKQINYYTEIDEIEEEFKNKNKFKELSWNSKEENKKQ